MYVVGRKSEIIGYFRISCVNLELMNGLRLGVEVLHVCEFDIEGGVG